jgi:hypothetical protein
MQNKRVFGLMTAAGCALFAASAMGAATVSESFETQTAGAAIADGSKWTGYGTVTATNYTAAGDSTVGRPIIQASGNPGKVLAVEGRVTRTAATTANNAATVDMMVQIALPDDDLAFPSGTETTDIQIAVGVETDATLKIWCKNKDGTVGWNSLGSTSYTVGSWHRVSFTFDYANQLCQVRVDGDPVITGNGILKAGSTLDGSWYTLATSTTKSALESVQIIGSTSIDDLLVSEAATVNAALPAMADASTPITVNGVDVDKTWIEEQGITRDAVANDATAPDGTMKLSEKYAAGYDVADGKTFGVKSMSMSGTKATITFDQAAVKSGYTYVLSTSTDNDKWSDATTITITSGEAAAGSKTIDLGDAAVKYLKLKVVK